MRTAVALCLSLLCLRASAADLRPADTSDEESASRKFLNTVTPVEGKEHRYLFVGAIIAASIGGGLTYWAQGEVRRANSLNLAVDSRKSYQTARATIAGANVLFAVAGAFALYGVFSEILPQNSAGDGSLTLNF